MTGLRPIPIYRLVLCTALLAGTTAGKADPGRAVSPLQSLLTVFAAQAAVPWPSFDVVSGVRWRDHRAVRNPGSVGPDTMYDRSGNLLLSGFGVVDVPDGKLGAAAGTKKDNEGDVGVTLSGDARTVQSIALLKFYPSDNTQDIIQRQFSGDATVKPIADECALDYGTTTANTQKNAFYRLDVGASTPVYAETSVDTDGGNQGPGTTTFVFYRSKPTQRISAMRCKWH